MSQTPGSFRPSELDGADQPTRDADLASAWSTARELEAALPPESVAPSPAFADRVMAAVALEPAPRPAGFLAALRASPGPAGLIASVREAWTVATSGTGRPARARGLAMAYVLAVVIVGTSLTGVAVFGAAGALGFLDGESSLPPTHVPTMGPTPEPSGSPAPASPEVSGSPEPTGSPEPSESAEPHESHGPEGSDDHETAAPSATPDSSPHESDDSGASPSPSDDDSSAEPSETPRPSDAPEASETPN